MLMEKTSFVLKRALKSAGLLTKVVLVENFIDNEIVIKFSKQTSAIKDGEGFEALKDKECYETSLLVIEPKVEQVYLDEEYHDSPEEENDLFEPADSTFHDALGLNESMTADASLNGSHVKLTSKASLKSPYVKLERMRPSNLKSQSLGTPRNCQTRHNRDSGCSRDNMFERDDDYDRDDVDNDFDDITAIDFDPNLETDSSYVPDLTLNKPKRNETVQKISNKFTAIERKGAKNSVERPQLHCELCDFKTKSSKILQRHIAIKHGNDKPYKCSLCRFKTSVEGYLYQHMKKHPDRLPFKCEECDHGCRTAAELARHIANCHEKAKSFQCQSCPFVGKNRAQFLRHARCHYVDETAEENSIVHEVSDVHCMLNATEDVAKAVCNLCGRKYQSGIWLEQHTKRHEEPEKYALSCTHCDTEFEDKLALESHLNSMTGEAPFACRSCDTDISYDNDLASSTTSALHAEEPKLMYSRQGRIQIEDRGYVLCINKAMKNNRTYFRCTNRRRGPNGKKTGCNATASVIGPLEEGRFKIEFHAVEKHDHEPSAMANLDKRFNDTFKRACMDRGDVPVPRLFEEVKMDFLATLSPEQRPMFHERLNSNAKNKFMIGYRLKDAAGNRSLVGAPALKAIEHDVMLTDEASGF